MNKKTGVGALIISAETHKVLLNLRSPYKTHSQCWSLWGGMIEEGETPKMALLRELEEEINFVPNIARLYPFDIYESKDKHFRYYTFICIVEKEFIPEINKEAVGYAWTNVGTWPKPLHDGARKTFCNNKSLEKIKMILEDHQ